MWSMVRTLHPAQARRPGHIPHTGAVRLEWFLRLNPFLRWPTVTLAATGVLVLLLGARWLTFEVSTETGTLLAGDQRSLATYEEVRRMLRDETVVVLDLQCGPVFTSEAMATIRRLSDAFANQPGLIDVKSFTHSFLPVRSGLGFDMVPLVSERPEAAELERLRRFALENPLIRNVMVSADERHTILLNTYDRDLSRPEQQARFREETILEPFRAAGCTISVLGLPLIEEEIRRTLHGDLRGFLPAAGLILVAILWLTYRSWRIVLLLGSNQLALLLLIPALVEALGYQINVFTAILLPMLVAIHLTLLVHLFTAWTRARARHAEPAAVMREALAEVLLPSWFAALTTAAGFLSLLASEVRLVRETGTLGAAGVALAFAVAFGPGLATLTLLARRRSVPLSRMTYPEKAPSTLLRPRPALLYGTALLALALAGIGLTRLRCDVRPAEFLNRHSPTRQALASLNAHYGGVNVVQIEVDTGQPGGIQSLPFLQYLQSVERFTAAQPEVSGAYSYAQLLALMNQLWEGQATGASRLPDNAWTLQLFTLALKAYPSPFLTALADDSARKAFLIVRTPDQPARQYLEVLHRIVDFAQTRAPAGIRVNAAQGLHTILEADRRIFRSLTRTAGLSVLSILVALAVLWRSLRLALVALAVNLFAVVLVLGLAGWAAIPLNSVTLMIVAITLGVAVDGSVHLLTRWRAERRDGTDVERALRRTLQVKARPIVSAALVLLAVFLLFGFSSFPPVVDFGWLAAGTFAAALLGVLFLLPGLLSRRGMHGATPPGGSAAEALAGNAMVDRSRPE